MRHWRRAMVAAAMLAAPLSGATAVEACRVAPQLDAAVLGRAELVVVGRVVGYRLAPRPEPLTPRRGLPPTLGPEPRLPRIGGAPAPLPPAGEARFLIRVERVLAGRAPALVSAVWRADNFARPEMLAAGPWLIGLVAPAGAASSPADALRPSRAWPPVLEVVGGPCERSFLLPAGGAEARRAVEMLGLADSRLPR